MKYVLVYALIIAWTFSSVFAEEAAPPQKESIFMAGVGTLVVNKAQKGADTDLYVLPLLIDTEHRLLIYGTNINYVLFYEDGWMFSATGAPRLEDYKNSESTHLSGMRNRHNTYELGATLSKEFSWGKLEGLFLADILDEHRGQEFRFNYSKSFADVLEIRSLKLTPSAGFNWRSHQLNDYYGVKANETTAARGLYRAGSATNILTGLRAD
ncbi:MAG: MipA/OmpV family protein [Phycisphaerae bacterium]|nr:MipA/OmpV family protein [Phycisphaerae bacterium]